MSLDLSLSIASGGMANIQAQLALISQNVANAATPGYAVEVGSQQAMTADGIGLGVRTDPATLQINHALQSSLITQNATVSGLQTTQTSLQAIDSVLGTPGSGSDLGSVLGKLQSSFSTLLEDPSDQTQQSTVVAAATTLAGSINTLSASYATQRQAAQTGLQSAVTQLNTSLTTIGQISSQIVAMRPTGESTADLENQRSAAVQTLSSLLNVSTVEQPDGDLTVFTPGGLPLATAAGSNQFSLADAATPAGAFYPGGGVPGIMLGGTDVTSQMTGGQIGAGITLRDTTLPTSQGELDEFAQGVSSRFAGQGLQLFTDPTGSVPAGGGIPPQTGYVGYASTIQVNSAVITNPSLVRDGTVPVASIGFTPNTALGPAGFTTLISNIVNFTFGTQAQTGTPQPILNTSGLGASGTLSAPFSDSGDTLAQFATSLVSSQSAESAATTGSLTTETALQTDLNTKITAASGVNMDSELSNMLVLQNAYGANAKLINAVQSMFAAILAAVQ